MGGLPTERLQTSADHLPTHPDTQLGAFGPSADIVKAAPWHRRASLFRTLGKLQKWTPKSFKIDCKTIQNRANHFTKIVPKPRSGDVLRRPGGILARPGSILGRLGKGYKKGNKDQDLIRVWDSIRHAQAEGLARRIQRAAELRTRHRA